MGGEGNRLTENRKQELSSKRDSNPGIRFLLMTSEDLEGSVEERLFSLSRAELIELVLQNQTVSVGLSSESDFLSDKLKAFVDLKIKDNKRIEELEQRVQETEAHWCDKYSALEEEFIKLLSKTAGLNKSVESKNRVLGEKSGEIRELQEKILAVDEFVADISKQFETFSSQEKRNEMLPRLETILNFLNCFTEEYCGNVSNKKITTKKK